MRRGNPVRIHRQTRANLQSEQRRLTNWLQVNQDDRRRPDVAKALADIQQELRGSQAQPGG